MTDGIRIIRHEGVKDSGSFEVLRTVAANRASDAGWGC